MAMRYICVSNYGKNRRTCFNKVQTRGTVSFSVEFIVEQGSPLMVKPPPSSHADSKLYIIISIGQRTYFHDWNSPMPEL